MSSIRELVREAHACGVNAFMGVPPIPVRLREINISGLRERRLHTHGYTFVKVSIDNREILKTDVSPEPTAPTWVFARPKILSIYPSSVIRFCVFRWHRHMQTEEYVGEVEGTAWAFCSESYAQTPSEDSPNLRIHPSISLDMPKEQPFPAAPEEVDIVEVERHRIEVLRRQRSTRKQGGFVKGVLPGLLDVVTDDMDSLLRLLDHVAPAVPLSRIAIILLHEVQKMVKAHGKVDSDIEDLLALLREVLVHAASCEGDDIKKQAVKLVGDSASIIDGWVHSRSGKQLVKATYIQQRVKVFHAQLTEFNAMLRDMVKARPAQRLVQHSVQSVKINDPEDLPELDRSDTISVLDSPTPQTPPATFVQFDGPRPASKGDGPLTHVVKEVETHLGEWHHVKECYGIQADGEIAVVDNVSVS